MKYSVGCQCCEPPCTMPDRFCYSNEDAYNQWDIAGTINYYRTAPSWLPTYETPPLLNPFNPFPAMYVSVASGFNMFQTGSLPLHYAGYYSCPQLQMTCINNATWTYQVFAGGSNATIIWKSVDRYYYYLYFPTGTLADDKTTATYMYLYQYIIRNVHVVMDKGLGFPSLPQHQEMTKNNVVLFSGGKRWTMPASPVDDDCKYFYCEGTDVDIIGYGVDDTGVDGVPQYECPGLGSSTPVNYIPWIKNIQPTYGYSFSCSNALTENRPVMELIDCDIVTGATTVTLCGGVTVGGNTDVTVTHVKVGPQPPIIGGMVTKDNNGNVVSVIDTANLMLDGGTATYVGSLAGGTATIEAVGVGSKAVVATGGILAGSGNILSGFIATYSDVQTSGGVVLAGVATVGVLSGGGGGGGL